MLRDDPRTIYLKDYRPPQFLIDSVHLEFDLGEQYTEVSSSLAVRRNPVSSLPDADLVLQGQDMELLGVRLDGRELSAADFHLDADSLTLTGVPENFTLGIRTRLRPQDNTSLEGLYRAGGMFCTQCEAEGFRKITYYLDRPDVMARFTTTLRAQRGPCPVLLSNGNPVDSGLEDNGRHWVRWEDPHPKPSYLFALVAGDLVCIEDTYQTLSGRKVDLRIYVEPRNADKCEHAMHSLINAMRWDEQVFGREYDLDIYMIVATDDFNMGAMENKGLNIFNSKYVLARAETATDSDYQGIEGVIGHEYFHNWTGNRVTCRDWFQLSLKEGLTVFRDQEFSADMGSRAVTRIQDVRRLRAAQFAEDTGPMAHPVRPEAYIEINNFYTATVYEKGAEVIRMMHTLLGAARFRRGMDLYFERHDGQAVTTDDFVAAMEDSSGVDLDQFRIWYRQAGTPVLHVRDDYDPDTGRYTLTVGQSCPATPGQPHKEPMHIPLRMALLDAEGGELEIHLDGEPAGTGATERVLQIREKEHSFVFSGLRERPTPSLLRGFSAPVRLDMDTGSEELAFLMGHDPDPFNRWEAAQRLMTQLLMGHVRDGAPMAANLPSAFVDAVGHSLRDHALDPALVAEALTLPGEQFLADQALPVDVDGIHQARRWMMRGLAKHLGLDLHETYGRLASRAAYRFDAAAVGQRSLRNLALAYLMEADDDTGLALCREQFETADNMTDGIQALALLGNHPSHYREQALADFYARWRDDPLVVDKWFAIQATSRLPDTLERVQSLMQHEAFSLLNPNKVRALVGAFSHGNALHFHAISGDGYAFLADQVLALNPLNPQIAARLLSALSRWRRYDGQRQALMRSQLERISGSEGLSSDVYEVANKSLQAQDPGS